MSFEPLLVDPLEESLDFIVNKNTRIELVNNSFDSLFPSQLIEHRLSSFFGDASVYNIKTKVRGLLWVADVPYEIFGKSQVAPAACTALTGLHSMLGLADFLTGLRLTCGRTRRLAARLTVQSAMSVIRCQQQKERAKPGQTYDVSTHVDMLKLCQERVR